MACSNRLCHSEHRELWKSLAAGPFPLQNHVHEGFNPPGSAGIPLTIPAPQDVTRVLQAAGEGDRSAASELLPLVYDELRRLAHQRMAAEPAGHTLQPTALVHEAYIRLLGDRDVQWENRAHFFGAAAEAMRRILVERARKAHRLKHGGGRKRLDLDTQEIPDDQPSSIIAMDEALTRLQKMDPRKGQIIMLRYFAGLSIEDTARALGLSKTTVKDEWSFARAWLYRELSAAG
jgi:RNA polymerase sigma factor (TIGR02999 family)